MKGLKTAPILAAVFLFSLPALSAAKDADWSAIRAASVTMFYPGAASWDFLTSDNHRLGGHEIKQTKKDCRHCHLSKAGELDLQADEIAAGALKMKRTHEPFEPEPIPGKKGVMHANVQAAYDTESIYIRVEWEGKGAAWQSKNSEAPPDRVSIQLNKTEPAFKKYGCFTTCHNDLNTMPGSPSKKEVRGNPYYAALDRDDVRLYAFYAKETWNAKRDEKELEKRLKNGGLIDLWSLELSGGAVKSLDGWIFDDRQWEAKSDIEGRGGWANGKYSVVFKRRLKTGGTNDIQLGEGDTVSAGLAIHDDGASKRRHYVSFPFTIGLNADADIKAENIK
ncbi:MAG: hypothetical protein HZB21_04525 [Deltaproteobacteria bacterium]|nr:hypothetical protein [Deltaproteobacteria bacterium]